MSSKTKTGFSRNRQIGPVQHATVPAGVAAIARRIRESPEGQWSIEEMAAEAGLSRSHFCYSFRNITGMSPSIFLKTCRLQKAARLLRTSKSSLLEVASSCGYDSEVTLSRVFKRHFGLTPGAYRKASRVMAPDQLPSLQKAVAP